MRSLVIALGVLVGCAGSPATVVSPQSETDNPQLWMQVAGHGDPTVVFDAGDGDSSAWTRIEPMVRGAGVRTVLYDRAGFGKSPPAPGPYRIDDEAAALTRALDRFGVKGPVVLVASGYGGLIATLVAASDKRIVGAVLVEADVIGFDDSDLAHLTAKYTAAADDLQRTSPALARSVGPALRALPDTVRRLHSVAYPQALPTIDLLAEQPSGDENAMALRQAHAAFVAASPARLELSAAGAEGNVVHDQPDAVVDAVSRMLRFVHRG